MNTSTNTRGVQNGIRQCFIYRGIQVMPVIDGGWLCVISGKLQCESTQDEICVVIDAMHIVLDAFQQREPKTVSASPKQAISGGAVGLPSRRPRRYSTSSKQGAA